MTGNLAGEAGDAVAIGAGIETARSYVGPTESTHEPGKPHRRRRPASHRDFENIENIVGGNAFDAVWPYPALELAQRRLPGVFRGGATSRLRALPQYLREGAVRQAKADLWVGHRGKSVPPL